MDYTIKTISDTNKVAGVIYNRIAPGTIIFLQGHVGAGKTTLARLILAKFGVKLKVKSPTFTLMNVYNVDAGKAAVTEAVQKKGIKKIAHIDCYRLKTPRELEDIGANEYFEDPETLCIVEWPELGHNVLKKLSKQKTKIINVNLYRNKKSGIMSLKFGPIV